MMGEVIRVSGRIPEVGDLLREAMVSQRFADVALCCSGGQRFLAHRLVLSAASPYLQEVLLAHGRAAGYGEPITMILADVEGPELSAILGFVYTGSATIPKSRLEAFTRAAETLHLTIPKFTAPSSFDRPIHAVSSHSLDRADDCKLNGNVKMEVTRTEARYSCHEDCSNSSSSWNFRVDFSRRDYEPNDDWLIARTIGPSSDNIGGSTRSCVVEAPNDTDFHFRREKISKVRCDEAKIGRSLHDHETTMRPRDHCGEKGFVPWPQKRSKMADSFDSFVDTSTSFPEKDHDPYDPRVHTEVRNFVRFGVQSLDSLSEPITPDNIASRMIVESPRAYEVTGEQKDRPDFEGSPESVRIAASLLSQHPTTARSTLTFEKPDHDSSLMTIPTRLPPAATLLLTGKSETAVSSSLVPDVAVTFANNSAIIGGRNSCGGSCCAWRTPRRHVANRVPASPWCQLARPAHHSPKTRPQLPRKPDEMAKAPPPSRVDWNASVLSSDTRGASTFPSPPRTMIYVDKQIANASSSHLDVNDHKNDSAGSTHGFQVPKTMGNPSSRLEVDTNNATQVPTPINYYDEIKSYEKSASLATASIEQFSSIITSRDVARASEKSVTIADILRKESRPHRQIDETSNIIANHEESRVRISQHAISPEATNKQIINDPPTCNPPPTSTRIELSHPISRLCDSVRKSNDESVQRAEPSFSLEIIRNTSNSLPPTTTTEEIVETRHDDKANSRGKTILSMAGGIVQSDDNNNEAAIEATENDVRNSDLITPENGNERITGEDGVAVNEEHKCDQCGKTFVTRASLKVHVRTHSGEKPFRCNDCGKEFSQLRNYKYHRSVHEGTREFAATCPECGKYFNDRGYLSSHMKIHRNRKEYACTECGKSFNQRVAYNMHVRIHTGVKPHQCDQCGKAFSRKMLLKQHLRTHSGERPYQCQICHKAFADRSNMTLHTRLHSGLKPYQCTLCSKAFTKKHHLKTHLNYHTGTKPYSCPNCSLRFSQSSNMRTHYKKCCSIAGGGLIEHQQPNKDSAASDKGQAAAASRNNDDDIRDSASMRIVEAPSIGGRTNALTPPSSDQESSSFQTPTKRVNESTQLRTRSSRILDVVDAVRGPDT